MKDNKNNNSPHQKDQVPVQPDLFTYPVPAGQNPALMANECSSCSTIFFPKRDICPVCFTGDDLVDREISGRGKVYTSSVIHIPSPSGIRPPYVCGYVDMIPESGSGSLRIFAHFTDPNPGRVACGQIVELAIEEIRRDDKGRAVMAHVFRPVDEG